jgi:hypothetical protein
MPELNMKNAENFVLYPTVTHTVQPDQQFKSYEFRKLTELLESVLDRTTEEKHRN